MKKEFIFQISKSTAVRSEESVRIPFATSQMLLRVRLEKEYSGMGYLVVYDPEGRVRLWHLLGHGERELLIGSGGKDTSVGGVPGSIEAGNWKVELFLFTEYIAQFLGDAVVNFVIELETFDDETAEEDGKMPFQVSDVIGEQEWISKTAAGKQMLPVLDCYDWKREVCRETMWYKGDFHTHTTLSDGKETTASAMEKAKLTELDFYVPTEHNAIHTGWVDTSLLILPGIEITTDQGHCNFFGIDRMPKVLPQLMEHVGDESSEQFMYEAIAEAKERNWIVSVNHPFLHIWKWKHGGLALQDMDCLEVINDPTYLYAKEANEQAVAFLDLLWEDGWNIWGVGGSDSHNLLEERYDGAELPSIVGDPGTFVFCEGLSAKELMKRVRCGNMYVSRFCRGVFEIFCKGNRYLPGDELQFEEDTVSVEYHIRVYDTTERICLYMIRDGRRELLRQTEEADGSVTAEAKAEFRQGEWSYMRAEVRNEAGELLAYVNPVYHGRKTHECMTFAEAVKKFEGR